MNTIDLHIHTTVSDGAHTPEEVVALAHERGLRVMSITDHDNVAGVAPAIEAARSVGGLEIIPGIEISADAGDIEIHILGYYVDVADVRLSETMAASRAARVDRAREIIARLGELGIAVSWERVAALSGGDTVGRVHLALALQEAGYVETVSEAFDRYLADDRPAFVPRPKLAPPAALDLIRGAGGIPVLAHPWAVTHLVAPLVEQGLQGLEVYYPSHSVELVGMLKRLAESHGLVCTGGSDFHGLSRTPHALACTYVPPEAVSGLRALRESNARTREAPASSPAAATR